MKKNTLIIIIIILAAAVLGWIFMSRDYVPKENKTETQNVVVEAKSLKEVYSSGDEVELSIKVANAGSSEVCLSTGATGNISFVSVKRNGNAVETRSAPSFFLTSFSQILASRLVSVNPGGNIEFNLKSEFDPGLGAQALMTTIPEESSGLATMYNVEKQGEYEVELVYEYLAGPSVDCDKVLENKTNTVKVTFKVE